MYEDSWYSFVSEFQQKKNGTGAHGPGHRRKESLLQQPNGANEAGNGVDPLPDLFEEHEDEKSPPDATLTRRAKSYSDFFDIVQTELSKDATGKKGKKRKNAKNWDTIGLVCPSPDLSAELDPLDDAFTDELLETSQQEYTLYHDQLAMTERHLEALIQDTNGALKLLESLSLSFRAVEDQTTSFQAQCDDLLSEQRRLRQLADEVGTDYYYYSYLDNVTRRLNAPGASRLVDDDAFAEVLSTLDSCIVFMSSNPSYRDAESYLARYQALLTKALHLLEVGFTNRLEKVSTEVSKQIAATQSESARHALAYGRFEEMVLESYALIPNIQRVVLNAYDQLGNPRSGLTFDIYSNTANNLFQSYWTMRDRDVKPITQHDLDSFKAEVKSTSAETAARNFVKQCFERSHNETVLFGKIFSIDPQYSADTSSAFASIKSYQRSLINGVNIAPIANNLQAALQPTDIQTTCSVVGWITNEYLLLDYDEDETHFITHCRGMAARLLSEHLWVFTDGLFDAEITRSITKTPLLADALKIGPVTNGVSSSNAYPPVKKALELLGLFDHSMPKERCQRNSPVVFRIIKESIAALRRAESRIKQTKNGTDSDLFLFKNLLILKNELVSLEIGDVRSQELGLQHFGQIWETLSPQNLMGLLSTFSNYIPGSSLWSRGSTPSLAPSHLARSNSNGPESQDAGEQLDELLRQSIYAFTQRWATTINEARARKLGGKNMAKIEKDLDDMLDRAFSNQPEVVAKLKEAIQANAEAQNEAERQKKGV